MILLFDQTRTECFMLSSVSGGHGRDPVHIIWITSRLHLRCTKPSRMSQNRLAQLYCYLSLVQPSGQPLGALCPECQYSTAPLATHASSSLKIALRILDVFTPTCRAISASDKPSSSRPLFAIVALSLLIFLRRPPPLSSFGLIRSLLHSSPTIPVSVLPPLRSFN